MTGSQQGSDCSRRADVQCRASVEAVETLELQETEQFSCDLPASSGGHAVGQCRATPLNIQWSSVPPDVFLLFNTYQKVL